MTFRISNTTEKISADFDLDEGNELIFMDKIVPDYDINTGNVKFSVKTKRYPESQEVTEKGPFTISNTTEKISMRARGRQARIRVSCDSTGTSWRWGSLRMAQLLVVVIYITMNQCLYLLQIMKHKLLL